MSLLRQGVIKQHKHNLVAFLPDESAIKKEPGIESKPKITTVSLEAEPEFETMSMSGVQILVRPPTKSLVQPAVDPEHFKVSSARPFQCDICKRAFKDVSAKNL